MSPGQRRRWIQTRREVRIGRPVTHVGRPAKNRRLIHRRDLRRALGLAETQGEQAEETCNPRQC
jgi:hypothetical protein